MKVSEWLDCLSRFSEANKTCSYKERLGNNLWLKAYIISPDVSEFLRHVGSGKGINAGYYHVWSDTEDRILEVEEYPEEIRSRVSKVKQYLDRFIQNEVDYPTCPEDIK